jgi:HEAT repeat protein
MAYTSAPTERVLLSDEQMRRFVVDGYLRLDCGLPPELHEAIYNRLQYVLHQEGNPGNNILPAVPEMQQVLDSPVISGAIASILGPEYVLHPHRFVHNIEPAERDAEGVHIGKGSASFVGWHQDSHSPLARPRHHFPRYLMLLYFPQDTPAEMGPTQVIPATQYHANFNDADRERGFQAPGPAGTCTLVHFDIVHGGSMNMADRTRHMAKFVFVRTCEPTQPAWECGSDLWETPADHHAPADLPVLWERQWNWLCGKPERAVDTRSQQSVEALIAGWDADPFTRLTNIYTLAAMGASAVQPLYEELKSHTESPWTESAIVMENAAYALAAAGACAVRGLAELLTHESDWVRINALFALGEIGTRAVAAMPAIIQCLSHGSHPVVRTALDALGHMHAAEQALPQIRRLLTESNPDWQAPLYRKWTGENQVRLNAIMALLQIRQPSDEVLQTIAASLNDPCGYVGGFGIEALLRNPTPEGLSAALDYLKSHRWDNTLNRGIRTY